MQLDAAAPPAARSEVSAAHSAVAAKASYFSADLTVQDSRPRKTRTLLSLCINQIGEFRALHEPGVYGMNLLVRVDPTYFVPVRCTSYGSP